MSKINKTYVFETVLISGGTSGTTVEFITGATFNTSTGNLEMITVSGNTVNVPMDGRYTLNGHTHDISEITGFTDNSSNWDSAYSDIITGMTVTGDSTKLITLEQRNGGTITASFIDNNSGTGGTGDVVTGMTFNTSDGNLELSTLSGSTITENLDGRYFISGPITFSCETSGSTTYIGYGEVGACKIRRIETISGGTYTAFWSNGEENLNKLWVNRLSYPYF